MQGIVRIRLPPAPDEQDWRVHQKFEFRWLGLAEQAHGTGGALGHESGLTATSFPLHDKPAAYPAEYAKRAGELIARSALSLQRLRQKKKAGQ